MAHHLFGWGSSSATPAHIWVWLPLLVLSEVCRTSYRCRLAHAYFSWNPSVDGFCGFPNSSSFFLVSNSFGLLQVPPLSALGPLSIPPSSAMDGFAPPTGFPFPPPDVPNTDSRLHSYAMDGSPPAWRLALSAGTWGRHWDVVVPFFALPPSFAAATPPLPPKRFLVIATLGCFWMCHFWCFQEWERSSDYLSTGHLSLAWCRDVCHSCDSVLYSTLLLSAEKNKTG